MSKTNKLVCGVGINDADYPLMMETVEYIDGKIKRKVSLCPFYVKWCSMLDRCYSTKYQTRRPSYVGCHVIEEWKLFSKFKSWMETKDWEGKQLDKDLLFPGNKVYGPETCCFVPRIVNGFVVDASAGRGDWPIGVHCMIDNQKFVSKCSNPFTKRLEHLGYFDNAGDAHNAWLKRKLELARELASLQTDDRVAKALVERYENYQ